MVRYASGRRGQRDSGGRERLLEERADSGRREQRVPLDERERWVQARVQRAERLQRAGGLQGRGEKYVQGAERVQRAGGLQRGLASVTNLPPQLRDRVLASVQREPSPTVPQSRRRAAMAI